VHLSRLESETSAAPGKTGTRTHFGQQRPATDILAIGLLCAGFSAIAYALWVFTGNWIGVLLPVGFLVGAWASLRVEVREIEIRPGVMLVRTFFREYPIPRAHVTNVALTPQGAAIDVLNGRRYLITPPQSDAEEVAVALAEWLRAGDDEPLAGSSKVLPATPHLP
jgi:hypothetical protein